MGFLFSFVSFKLVDGVKGFEQIELGLFHGGMMDLMVLSIVLDGGGERWPMGNGRWDLRRKNHASDSDTPRNSSFVPKGRCIPPPERLHAFNGTI
jgi:hypothetical protein